MTAIKNSLSSAARLKNQQSYYHRPKLLDLVGFLLIYTANLNILGDTETYYDIVEKDVLEVRTG